MDENGAQFPQNAALPPGDWSRRFGMRSLRLLRKIRVIRVHASAVAVAFAVAVPAAGYCDAKYPFDPQNPFNPRQRCLPDLREPNRQSVAHTDTDREPNRQSAMRSASNRGIRNKPPIR